METVRRYNGIIRPPFTPVFITELTDDEVFVFGSNLAGQHGGGAARIAYETFGAEWGVGVGLTGQSYAIPTMQGGVETIRPYVDDFIAFAKAHQELFFPLCQIRYGVIPAVWGEVCLHWPAEGLQEAGDGDRPQPLQSGEPYPIADLRHISGPLPVIALSPSPT